MRYLQLRDFAVTTLQYFLDVLGYESGNNTVIILEKINLPFAFDFIKLDICTELCFYSKFVSCLILRGLLPVVSIVRLNDRSPVSKFFLYSGKSSWLRRTIMFKSSS